MLYEVITAEVAGIAGNDQQLVTQFVKQNLLPAFFFVDHGPHLMQFLLHLSLPTAARDDLPGMQQYLFDGVGLAEIQVGAVFNAAHPVFLGTHGAEHDDGRITSYNVCYTKLLRDSDNF